MVIFCSLPVPRSLAETCTMPLASMSKVTSICGTPRGAGAMPVRLEAAQRLVVGGHLALALEHVDLDLGLAVGRGGEHLALVGRDGGVAVDQAGEDAAHGLNAQGQGRDVEQQHVLDLAAQDAGLNGRADRHTLVGVDALKGLLAGHRSCTASCTAGMRVEPPTRMTLSISLAVIDASESAWRRGLMVVLHQVRRQLVELGAGQGDVQVLGAGGVRGDEGLVDVGGHHAGKLNLGLLRGILQALHGLAVLGADRCPPCA